MYLHLQGVKPNEPHRFTTKVPRLEAYGFNDQFRSSCSTGSWIVYQTDDYLPGGMLWMAGQDNCINYDQWSYIDRQVSSLRYAGASNNYSVPCFSIYEKENFWGQEYASCNDSPSLGVLSGKGNSILITAKSEWSFYPEEDFAGSPTCYTFGDSWGYYSSLGDNSNKFKSVKKGCQSGAARAEPSLLNIIHQDENGAYGNFV